MAPQLPLDLLAFTDPVCTWCWGSEPVMRKIQTWFGDQIRIIPVMGGLVEDIRAFYDRANQIGGDPERSNEQIARHWLEASERHGMPVRTEGFRLFSRETVSTYPQNIAYKAVELCAPRLAPRFLRRLREASAAEARETGRREVLIELASEVAIDLTAFLGALDDGSAERAFRVDLELVRAHGARGFPTFLFRWGGRELMLRGYQSFQNMQSAIAELGGDRLAAHAPRKSTDAVLEFLRDYGRAAPVEIRTVFDLSRVEQDALMGGLEETAKVRRSPAGSGFFWDLRPEGMDCDPTTGVCAL